MKKLYRYKKKGSALLVVVLILSAVTATFAVGAAKISQASLNSTGSNKVTAQAQQYAISQAELMRSVKYSDLKAQNKQTISNSDFKSEISLGNESDFSSSVKQKEVNIKIYHDNEELPRSSLSLTRYNAVNEDVGGCQIVTGTNNVSFTSNGTYKSVTVISSATFIPQDGSWTGTANYNIAVNGSSLGTLNCTSVTYKSGSRGHYWGTKTSVTNQKTVSTDISKGSTISVNLANSSRMDFSTVTVILGS